MHRVQDLARTTERAFWTATSGRPGAVLVNVPMDLFNRQVEEYADTYPLPRGAALPGLDRDTAERIARALLDAERPLIYFGGGLREPAARQALSDLAEHLDIPLAHSLMGKGVLPDSHPLLLGMPGFWGLETTHAYTRGADVVLALATRFAETDASSWDPAYTWTFGDRQGTSGSKLIQIDIDPAEIGRNYPVEIGAVADAADALRAVGEAVRAVRPEPLTRDGLRDTVAAARRAVFDTAREDGRSDAFPCGPSASSPTCATRCPTTRCSSPMSAGTRTASPSATNSPRAGASSPPAGPRPWASARPRRSGCNWHGRTAWWSRSSATAG